MKTRYALAGTAHDGRDFRGASWGMSKDEVKFSESVAPLSEGEGFIAYGERVMGLDAVVGFHFMENSLVEAGYAFREPLEGGHTYIKEYRKLKGMLTGSYGEPSYDECACGECRGFCVCCPGEESADRYPLVYLSEWATPRSVIRLVLMSEGRGFEFGILHRSKEHEMLVTGSGKEPRNGTYS